MPTILIDIMITFATHSALLTSVLQVSIVQTTMTKTLLRFFHLLKTPIFLALHCLFLSVHCRRELLTQGFFYYLIFLVIETLRYPLKPLPLHIPLLKESKQLFKPNAQ